MSTMTTDQLHDLLYDVQAELFNAIEHLETYVRETNDIEADNYLLASLKILASRQHGYLTSDLNIDDLIERLDETEPDDDEAADDSTDWMAQLTSGNMAWDTDLRRYVPIAGDES